MHDAERLYEKAGMVMSNAIIEHGRKHNITHSLVEIGSAIKSMGYARYKWFQIVNVDASCEKHNIEEQIMYYVDKAVEAQIFIHFPEYFKDIMTIYNGMVIQWMMESRAKRES